MKPNLSTINLKVTFAYATQQVKTVNMFTEREKIEKVPTGEVHIFEVVKVGEELQSRPFSFCKISHTDISKEGYHESDKRPSGLKVCPKCEEAWKKHPRSPWRAFVKGQGIKV